MADPADNDKAIIALKKGAQLLKYCRKGKPKFCPFRLSHDESTLIWISSSKEKGIKLASVSKIISGQRTAVFQRFPLPEKDHLSFSLIYNNGKRSLDLICKDKVEVEAWFTGLSALVTSIQRSNQSGNFDGFRDGFSYENGRESSLSSNSSNNKFSTSNSSLSNSDNDFSFVIRSTDAVSDIIMQTKASYNYNHAPNDLRLSISSVPSTSSHGSGGGGDDSESFGDIYIWGEIFTDRSNPNPTDPNPNPSANPISNPTNNPALASVLLSKAGILTPKPLESNVMLDVNYVACGVRHAALVTRQAEVFTWGEESSGRLGHGVGTDIIHPRLVESLSTLNVEVVDCGEFHTCAITSSGELYTWGDGTHNAGLLGHGTKTSHWIPKRVAGPIDGLQVQMVSCGTWHTALITTAGQLFTFGDGTFGALGHGNRDTALFPKEVESLKGLRTIAVSCGVWHSAAVVEVIMSQSSASSGKLFTWGDGDKYRLGHGDKQVRLKPTCVSHLIEYNFHKVACGHTFTLGLTTSGQLFSFGSSMYGQLGNSNSDGKHPRMVEDRLSLETAWEVACGAYHVAVLTASGEVYTWGKGANGRLGHGDTEDRKSPTLVEALKDRVVKRIACGSGFTAAICQHKWVSGAEQSQCSACRQAFGFTRKRHNCYNCGLVHCHACSSRKAVRAALAPNPGKPYRVCDSCYVKLSKVTDMSGSNNARRYAGTTVGTGTGTSKAVTSASTDMIKSLDAKAAKQGRKPDVYQFLQMKDIPFIGALDLQQMTWAMGYATSDNTRSVSPLPMRPGYTGYVSSGSMSGEGMESFKEANQALTQEVQRLRAEVETLKQRLETQEADKQKSEAKSKEAMQLIAEEQSKSKAAKEVIKSLTAQLKEMAERLPPGVYDTKPVRPAYLPTSISGQDLCNSTSGSNEKPSNSTDELFAGRPPGMYRTGVRQSNLDTKETERFQINLGVPQNTTPNPNLAGPPTATTNSSHVEAEWIEQYEPGVYLTLVALVDGTRELKRVRFSRRRFGEHQAESWWAENRDKVYEKYNVRGTDRTSSFTSF
ncbi:Regulator of chromosome condensation (RCC1) family with FYVE zinc finger domain-containing protein [Rhynchospora pubera]|uniref:Regulator of chromosome condensation (RCC1) family with FYVE zinc finger domain-containing protein n=1 Tax=Rhynchospora pubera TaxID=906938 RepID=A0AAV8E018_9POAL|nr:Regulator of chromosome condensation (RCC1) family with FYVE zinc finger domain-containing protein [Rhynchospora pubera]